MFFLFEGLEGARAAIVGGNWNNGTNDGLWNWNLNNSATNTNVNIGARLLIEMENNCALKSIPLGKNMSKGQGLVGLSKGPETIRNMRRVGNIYEKICGMDNILLAIDLAAKHKHNRRNVKKILANKSFYAEQIQRLLVNRIYTPSPYKTMTIKDNPSRKERLIHIPRFYPDQIIHWALMIQIKPILSRGMYAHTCGSVPGRGQSHGQRYLRRWLDQDHKNTKYCFKMDISKFYQNVDHKILKSCFRKVIKDRSTLTLIDMIVDSVDKGLPIGNYTSQWFSNFFLQGLDNLIKQEIGVKYYIRYVDDLVLLGPNKKKLHAARRKIDDYLQSINLGMKGDWQVFPIQARPIDFLGFKFYRTHTTLRARNALRIRRRVSRVAQKIETSNKDACAVISYLGMAHRCDSRRYCQKYVYWVISIKGLKGVIRNESRKYHLTHSEPSRNT